MRKYKPYIIVLSLFYGIIFLLPIISFENYSILSNTTSHLGAQKAPFNWIMNGGFIALGIVTIFYGKERTANYPIAKVLIYVFGISLIGTALFQHRPLTGEEANMIVDAFHSIFATSTGFSFSILAIVTYFILIEPKDKALAIALAVIAILIPILMQAIPSYQGLLQRLMFILAFTWLLYTFYKLEKIDE